MSPQMSETAALEDHLYNALEMAEHAQTRYHIREALQMAQLDRRPE